MTLFVDTSALFGAMDARDRRHREAMGTWVQLAGGSESMVTTNYVVVESTALLARRLGFEAMREVLTALIPLLQVHVVDRLIHDRGVAALLAAGRRDLSLVDCVSFEVMRQLGIDTAFAFDAHFIQRGFRCIP